MNISVRKRRLKDGDSWQIDFLVIHVDGARERIRQTAYNGLGEPCKTEAQAYNRAKVIWQERLAAKADAMAKRLKPDEVAKRESPRFSDFYNDKFLPVYFRSRDLSGSYTDAFDKGVKYNLIKPFGELTLEQINTEAVDRLKASLKVKAKTKNNILGYLRCVLAYAVEIECLDKMPKIEDVRYQRPEMTYYSKEELAELVKAAKAKGQGHLVMLLLGAHAGLRVSEMLGLKWSDINWVKHELVVANAIWRGVEKGTKSSKIRRVPMTTELEEALKAYRHLQSPRVLVSESGSMTESGILYWMTSILRSAKVDSERVLHKLRHSFAAHLVQAGVSLYRVANLLGHSDTHVTKIYAHLSDATKHDDIKALSARLA